MECNNLKQAFEAIEPNETEKHKMLSQILTRNESSAKNQRRNPVVKRLIPLMAAFVLLVGGTAAAGIALAANRNNSSAEEQTRNPDDIDVYSLSGRFVGQALIPDGSAMHTVSYSGVENLEIAALNDIVVVSMWHNEEVEISFYDEKRSQDYYEQYQTDIRFDTNPYVYFGHRSAHGGEKTERDEVTSVIYVTLPADFPLERLSVKTQNNVLVENCYIKDLSIKNPVGFYVLENNVTKPEKDRGYLMVVLENNSFDLVSIDADADVFVKDCDFLNNGITTKNGLPVGFSYENIWANKKRLLDFEDSEICRIFVNADNATVNARRCKIGSLMQGNIKAEDCEIETALINNIDDHSYFYGCKIRSITAIIGDREFSDLIVNDREFIIGNLWIVGSSVEDFGLISYKNESLGYDVISGWLFNHETGLATNPETGEVILITEYFEYMKNLEEQEEQNKQNEYDGEITEENSENSEEQDEQESE
ncbi:MAG: hypothetical protein FWH08_00665 [Oscillospiraceae bacterium]|nr:hypothetical protein [Oscillospiraceae bacterium]